MCGIVYHKRLDDRSAVKAIKKQYEKQKFRGMQGFGYVAVKENIAIQTVRATTEVAIMEALNKEEADEIMFHHRFPTSTPNFHETAHPIAVKNDKLKYDYSVVHNGIITNCEERKKAHETEGFFYTTEVRRQYIGKNGPIDALVDVEWNDSECLAIELAKDLDKDRAEQKGIDLTGSIAFICMKIDKETGKVVRTYFGRNSSNPLSYNQQKEYIAISSMGRGVDCKENSLYYVDYETNKIMVRDYPIGKSYAWVPKTETGVVAKTLDVEYEDEEGFRWPSPVAKAPTDNKQIGFAPKSEFEKEKNHNNDFNIYFDLLDEVHYLNIDLKSGGLNAKEKKETEERIKDAEAALHNLDVLYMEDLKKRREKEDDVYTELAEDIITLEDALKNPALSESRRAELTWEKDYLQGEKDKLDLEDVRRVLKNS